MRVLFYSRGFEQVGVEYLSSVLKQAGHEVELLFDPGFDDNSYVRLPVLRSLNRRDRLVSKAKAFAPDLIGFSCLTNLYPYVSQMAAVLKEATGARTVVGGPHPSALPDFVLDNEHVDMVCVGEAEEALLELVTRMESGEDYHDTRNFWFKRNGEIVRNPVRPLHANLDDLPLPDKDLYHRAGVFRHSLMVITSRGCPFNCNYCTHSFQRALYREHGYPIRRQSVDKVIGELRQYKEKYDARYFFFEDDDFASNLRWLTEFSERYRREIGVPFYCLTNPAQTTENKLRLLKDAGCHELFMGIDSGSERIRRDRLNRKFTNEELIADARRIRDAGILLRCTAMFAIPDETAEDMMETVDLVTRIRPDLISTYTFYPYPKTRLFDYALEKGYIDEETKQEIYEGRNSLKELSVLKHPHKRLAYMLANLLPLLNKLPPKWQPALLRISRHEGLYRVSPLLYFLFLPLTYPTIGIQRIKDMLYLMWKSLLPSRAAK